MKKLITVNKSIYVFFSIILTLFVFTLIFALFIFKVENSTKAALIVAKDGNSLIVDSTQIYNIKKAKQLTIKVQNKFIPTKVKKIVYEEEYKWFNVEIYNHNVLEDLIPNSVLDVNIIYGEIPLYKFLFMHNV